MGASNTLHGFGKDSDIYIFCTFWFESRIRIKFQIRIRGVIEYGTGSRFGFGSTSLAYTYDKGFGYLYDLFSISRQLFEIRTMPLILGILSLTTYKLNTVEYFHPRYSDIAD